MSSRCSISFWGGRAVSSGTRTGSSVKNPAATTACLPAARIELKTRQQQGDFQEMKG